jgi:predicted aspartyl protease
MKRLLLIPAIGLALSGCMQPYQGHTSGDAAYQAALATSAAQNQLNAARNAAARNAYAAAQNTAVAPVRLTPPVRSVAIEYYEGQPMVRIAVGEYANFRCVLDTGASDLVIPMWVIDKLASFGLSDRDMQVIGSGRAELAGGAVMKTVNIVLREVTVGPWLLHNVPVTVPPAGSCLLGMSVLRAFGHPMIDFAGHRLVLED